MSCAARLGRSPCVACPTQTVFSVRGLCVPWGREVPGPSQQGQFCSAPPGCVWRPTPSPAPRAQVVAGTPSAHARPWAVGDLTERRCRGGCVPSPPSPACPGRSARVCGGRCSVAVRGHSRAGGRPDRPVTRPQGCVSAWAQGPLVKRAERRRMSLILWATASPLSRKGRSWLVFSVSKSDPSVPSRAKRPEA